MAEPINQDAPLGAEAEAEADADADAAMACYADGQDQMFAVVYDAVAPRLERYVRRHVRDGALRDDIVQQTFMQMHAKRGTFRRGAQVVPWAFCIARNFLIDSMRKSGREAVVEDADSGESVANWLVSSIPNAEQIIEAREACARIASVFAGLTDEQRAAFELTKGDGLSHEAAAQILGTTIMGIKQRVHKVHRKIRSVLHIRQKVVRDASDGEPETSAAVNRS